LAALPSSDDCRATSSKLRLPAWIWRSISDSRRVAASTGSCGDVRSRMCRARVCDTRSAAPSRRSSSFST
jgi:hypothetical protein